MKKTKNLRILRFPVVIVLTILSNACATYNPQWIENRVTEIPVSKKVAHTFFLAGGLGNGDNKTDGALLEELKIQLDSAGEQSTLLLLGDNISSEKRSLEIDRALVDTQLALTKNFKGNVTFLPGNNEWKSKNIATIQKTEEYLDEVEKQDDYVLPKNGCPLEHKVISDDLDLILIDSKWFVSNWSRVEGINTKCTDIVTRRRFAEELEGYINDGQGKNIVIAMHHPIFSNGLYAGYQSLKSYMLPLPILGSVIQGVKDLGAFSPDKLLSRRYNYLRVLVSSLAKASDRITVVSGHEESLQYLSGGDINQIISGSLGKAAPTKRSKDRINAVGGTLNYKGLFTYGKKGFAKLQYFEDGSSLLTFTTEHSEQYAFGVLNAFEQDSKEIVFKRNLSSHKRDSIYGTDEKLERSAFFKYLWGERYRRYYGIPVEAPVAFLDTLYGGLQVTKKGGGHQSYSIRLEDRAGMEFSMRSLRKNPLKFLKFSVPGVAYTEDDYVGSLPEVLISDFFTTAHPYMQLVINPIARAIDVNHADTRLFYIPKQKSLGSLNANFGNELYYIEQRPSDEQTNYKGYRRTIDDKGKITDFESTTDMLEKVKSDESYTVDQKSYVRARIFDMLLGDWDRHQDQWRWVEYEKENGDKEFMPVPRDRDNAFPKFDGAALKVIKLFVPITRAWQSYGPKITDIKWLSYNGSRLDKTLLPNYDAVAWEREALYIQQNLSPEIVEKAFLRLPDAVRDGTSEAVKNNLLKRLGNLPKYAKAYGAYLNKTVALHATEKDDHIIVTRLPNGATKVVMRRLLSDDPNEKFYERTFDHKETNEIWIYGLGDDDQFEVKGAARARIFVRFIGGYGEDSYNISNRKALKLYDWKHEELDFEDMMPAKQLTDLYPTNTFHWRYFKPSRNILIPTFGFRTDDGLFLGAKNNYIYNGLNGNPFRQRHSLAAKYHFKFQAAELTYKGIFANVIPKWNFEVDGYLTSDRFANNFFGLGNESINNEDALGRDYYRARMEQWKLSAGIAYHTLRIKTLFESFELSEVPGRLFVPEILGEDIFERQNYVGAETSAYYYSSDAEDFPTKALYFGLTTGYKKNVRLGSNQFGYLAFKTEISRKLIPSGSLVLGTVAEYKTNFGEDYFFYHAPALGGNNGLRGFRDERFTGKSYFYQSTDLRFRLKRYVTALVPITVGAYAGFDYGRIWEPDLDSNRWHTSQGIGLWASAGNYLAFNTGIFNSVEGNMFQIGLGFGF